LDALVDAEAHLGTLVGLAGELDLVDQLLAVPADVKAHRAAPLGLVVVVADDSGRHSGEKGRLAVASLVAAVVDQQAEDGDHLVVVISAVAAADR
jgi:hypothetical protein